MSAITFGFSAGGASAASLVDPLSFEPDAVGAGIMVFAAADGATISGAGASLVLCGATGFSCDTADIGIVASSTESINGAHSMTRPAGVGLGEAVDSVPLLEFRTRAID
ncbi:MAG: hypothetical protein ACKO1K_10915 [Burkholderiales bacterium]